MILEFASRIINEGNMKKATIIIIISSPGNLGVSYSLHILCILRNV